MASHPIRRTTRRTTTKACPPGKKKVMGRCVNKNGSKKRRN